MENENNYTIEDADEIFNTPENCVSIFTSSRQSVTDWLGKYHICIVFFYTSSETLMHLTEERNEQ